MKKFIIPDIHNKWKRVEVHILTKENDGCIYLGDYFDDFNDTVEHAKNTATWLKEQLTNKKDVFLLGNHDIPYMFPNVTAYRCSGNTEAKSKAINEILTQEDWARFKLCHFEDNFLFSHAGVHLHTFGRPMDDTVNLETIEMVCQSALASSKFGRPSMQLMAGRSRGGRQDVGGITWLDWDDEFTPIQGINQVVGHTPHAEPICRIFNNSINFAMDTHLKYFGILENGTIREEKIEI